MIDTVLRILSDAQLLAISNGGGGRRFVANPFTLSDRVGVSVGGQWLAVARADYSGPTAWTYGVTLFRKDGRTQYAARFQFSRKPIVPGVVDSVSSTLARSLAGVRDSVRMVRDALHIPPSWSPVTAVLVDTDGSIWLRGAADTPRVVWTILDPSGKPVGTVREPPRTRFIALDRGVWAVEKNADDVESVVRYTLR